MLEGSSRVTVPPIAILIELAAVAGVVPVGAAAEALAAVSPQPRRFTVAAVLQQRKETIPKGPVPGVMICAAETPKSTVEPLGWNAVSILKFGTLLH